MDFELISNLAIVIAKFSIDLKAAKTISQIDKLSHELQGFANRLETICIYLKTKEAINGEASKIKAKEERYLGGLTEEDEADF